MRNASSAATSPAPCSRCQASICSWSSSRRRSSCVDPPGEPLVQRGDGRPEPRRLQVEPGEQLVGHEVAQGGVDLQPCVGAVVAHSRHCVLPRRWDPPSRWSRSTPGRVTNLSRPVLRRRPPRKGRSWTVPRAGPGRFLAVPSRLGALSIRRAPVRARSPPTAAFRPGRGMARSCCSAAQGYQGWSWRTAPRTPRRRSTSVEVAASAGSAASSSSNASSTLLRSASRSAARSVTSVCSR